MSQQLDNVTRIRDNLTTITRLYTFEYTPEEYKKEFERAQFELRQLYERIFAEQETRKSTPNWWKEQFLAIADLLLEEYPCDKSKTHDVEISHNGTLFSFPASKNMILVGRMQGCDVQIEEPTVSRLHLIILKTNTIQTDLSNSCTTFVIDVGSLAGIKTIARTSSYALLDSVPSSRKVLTFNDNETFILEIGSQTITISPKVCVICLTNPRSVTFSCKHHVTCLECSKKINTCPLCKQQISLMKKEYQIHTFIKN